MISSFCLAYDDLENYGIWFNLEGRSEFSLTIEDMRAKKNESGVSDCSLSGQMSKMHKSIYPFVIGMCDLYLQS